MVPLVHRVLFRVASELHHSSRSPKHQERFWCIQHFLGDQDIFWCLEKTLEPRLCCG